MCLLMSSRPLGNLDVHTRRLQSHCLIKLLLCSLFCEKKMTKQSNMTSLKMHLNIGFPPGSSKRFFFLNVTVNFSRHITCTPPSKTERLEIIKTYCKKNFDQMAIDKGPSIPISLHPACVQKPYASSPESHREKRPMPLSRTPHFVYFCSCTYVVGIGRSHLFCNTLV